MIVIASTYTVSSFKGNQVIENFELVMYVYPRYRDEMDAGELADEIKERLGFKLKADFEGDKVDGSVTITSTEIIITMPKLSSNRERAILDSIVQSHYSVNMAELIAKRNQKGQEETKPVEYVYPRGNISSDDIKVLFKEVKSKLDPLAGIYLKDDRIVVMMYRELTPEEEDLLGEIIAEKLGGLHYERGLKIVSGSINSTNSSGGFIYGVSATSAVSTTSTSLVDLPDLKYTGYIISLADVLFFLSVESYNTGGRLDFRILVGGMNTPINMYFFGRDYYSQYWIRTMHGYRLNLSIGAYEVKAQWKVSAGTGCAFYRILSDISTEFIEIII